ncbi:MAG TPA: 6-carboxytetrahydropterin synthase [Dehalococcoidia bacterium]|nr:6-carboxytetrahydropterin synthase [Dehalococcoidia bacterium]
MSHRVTVQGESLRFAAAHFATFEGQAEPLHGHNYAVTVHLDGDLTADAWVIDFGRLRGLVAALCQELDHRFLLPLASPALRIAEREAEYEIAFQDRRYVMPRGDVAALPIDNSTAERLAEWLAGRLAEELRARGAANLRSLTVGVEEAPGQAGWYSLPVSP